MQQLTFYSLGLPLALLAYAGVVYEWLRMLTPRRNAGFLVALFVVSYFVAAGLLYMKYLRYMEPIIPSLCVLAAVFAASLVRNRAWVGARQLRALGWMLGGTVLVLTVLYGRGLRAYLQQAADPRAVILLDRPAYPARGAYRPGLPG